MSKSIVYTLSSDSNARYFNLFLFLESIRRIGDVDLKVIPFDDNLEITRQLCKAYSVPIVDIDPFWDKLGLSIFKDEEYRPGVPSWRLFRKFNALNLSKDIVTFIDANSVLLSSLDPIVSTICDSEFIVSHESLKRRNFKPWMKNLLNYINPSIGEGYGAAMWTTHSNVITKDQAMVFLDCPGLRSALGPAPEQSFMNLMLALNNIKVSKIRTKIPSILPIVSAENYDNNNSVNQNVILLKWSGKHNVNFKTLPLPPLVRKLHLSGITYLSNKSVSDTIISKLTSGVGEVL